MSKPAIVFIGFMGAGKSRALSSLGDVSPTVDADRWVEERIGMEIRQFFDANGEAAFREVEEQVVAELLAEADGGAIALGGGSVLSERVCAELARHTVVWLDVDADSAWKRVKDTERPLVAKGREHFDELLVERRPIYAGLADAIVPASDPRTVVDALEAIQALAGMPAGTKLLWATSQSGEYPVLVGRGVLGSGWWPLEGRRFCVADEVVADLYADLLRPLETTVRVPPGEASKSMARAERVLVELGRAGMHRNGDHVVALGGGVVGDLAGFCAHIYQRGVPVVQVPTTVIAQVDSAYGGKTGVDLELTQVDPASGGEAGVGPEIAKNYAGAYHMPKGVIADTSTLVSLSASEVATGFVEAVKTGLLVGGALWERVRTIDRLDPESLDDVVFACARYKCGVVADDEQDDGLRHVLNLGHTVGHAIEAAAEDWQIPHGNAVGLGLLAALRLSGAPELRAEVKDILARHDLPVSLNVGAEGRDAYVEKILRTASRDKKQTTNGVGFVLLSEPGKPTRKNLIPDHDVRAAVEELLS